MRVATSGVERVGAEEVGRTTRERRARGPRPRVHGRRHGRGGDEEGGERSGEGEALTKPYPLPGAWLKPRPA